MLHEREKKQQVISNLTDMFQNSNAVFLAHYHGLDVPQMSNLRGSVRKAGGKVVVAKNSLAKISAAATGYESLSDKFSGPIVIVSTTGNNSVDLAKIVVDFKKKNKAMTIVGGSVDQDVMDADEVKVFASLPSMDQLRAKLVGLISAPATKIVRVINEPAASLARVVSNYADQSN